MKEGILHERTLHKGGECAAGRGEPWRTNHMRQTNGRNWPALTQRKGSGSRIQRSGFRSAMVAWADLGAIGVEHGIQDGVTTLQRQALAVELLRLA